MRHHKSLSAGIFTRHCAGRRLGNDPVLPCELVSCSARGIQLLYCNASTFRRQTLDDSDSADPDRWGAPDKNHFNSDMSRRNETYNVLCS